MNAPTLRLPALPHLSFVWFVPVMGWTGLALAWLAVVMRLGGSALLLWLTVHTFDKRHLLLSPECG